MTIGGKVEVRVVIDNRSRILPGMENRAEDAVAKAAHDIEAGAKANIVSLGLIDTGNMLNSVRAMQVGPLHWRVEVGAFYGIFHELGTVRLPARPFLFPAAEAVSGAFLQAMSRLVT